MPLEGDTPRFSETLVKEVGGRELLWFDGVVLPPVGARINVDDLPQVHTDPDRFPGRHADAVVQGTRLWGTTVPTACVVIDVKLEPVTSRPTASNPST